MKDHEGKSTSIKCTSNTTIKEVKRKCIFDEGKRSYEDDLFTLSHKDKTLQDDMILASCYTPGQDICLEVDTFTLTLHNCFWGSQYPFVLKVNDVLNASSIIKKAVAKPEYLYRDAFLGISDNFCYDSVGQCCAEKDPPRSYQPGLVIYYRLKL